MAWMAYGQWTYTNLSSPKELMGVASSGTKAYFAGGHNGTNALTLVESYDVETFLWDTTGYLSIARQAPAGVACGSKLFFGGGVSANFNTVYSTVDIYDTATGVQTVANLSVARMDIAAISYGNKVIFAGGCNYTITCTNAVDIYDITSGNWTTSTLSSPRAGMAYAVAGDLAVFAGGFLTGGDVSDQVDIYNFTTNTWTTDTLSEARVWASAAVVGDKVIIAGGFKYFPGVPSNRIDIFDASTGIWTTEVLFEPRAWISAGAVNGKAFFAGGSNVANGGVPYDFSDIIDVYDAADSSWSVDVLSTPRTSQGIVAGDYFMVAGGTGDEGVLSSVEILYDPQTGISNQQGKTGNLNICPNPVKDKVTISLPTITGNTQLSIFTANGEKVLERQLTDTETLLDISALPQGVYFVRVQDEKGVQVAKMIKE